MKYIDYLDLGFKRMDLNDSVYENQTGYGGFVLVKKLNKRMSIEIYDKELNEPTLYIKKKRNKISVHSIKITTEQVIEMVNDFCVKKVSIEV